MKIDSKTLALPMHQYFAQPQPKDLVVIHWTAGWAAQHAQATWMASKLQEGTAYIVDRDGTVFQTFDEQAWAYHLGVAGLIGDRHDRRSIGIEMVSVGPLTLQGQNLIAYGRVIAQLGETSKYVALKAPWRGFQYFQRWTPAQEAALQQLVAEICARHKIPLQLAPPDRRDYADLGFFSSWRGIATHINFRGRQPLGTFDRWDCPSPFYQHLFETKGPQ